MIEFVKNNPAKVLGVVSAIFLVLAAFGFKIAEDQQAAILTFLTALITLVGGQVVQGVEDTKTLDALLTEPPVFEEIEDWDGE